MKELRNPKIPLLLKTKQKNAIVYRLNNNTKSTSDFGKWHELRSILHDR